MAAHWRSEEKNSSFFLSLSFSLSDAFCQTGKRTKAAACLNIPDSTAVIKVEKRKREKIYVEQYTLTPFEQHGKPCAVIEEVYYTNLVLIFLSKFFSFLFCAPIRREKERARERKRERERESREKTGVSVRRRRQAH
jgi:hypothetical protein